MSTILLVMMAHAVSATMSEPETSWNESSSEAVAWTGSCGDDAPSSPKCAHNGACVSGVCKCVPQFKGAQCDVFNFAPLNLAKGTGLRSVVKGEQISSWGGSVLLADDGKYHMWAAGKCLVAPLI
jgi:hypothetical protein